MIEESGLCSFCHEKDCEKKECKKLRKERAKRLGLKSTNISNKIGVDRGLSRRVMRKEFYGDDGHWSSGNFHYI